jgi:hypothetical protein
MSCLLRTIGILTLVACSLPKESAARHSDATIFREISFAPYGPIRLGEPLSNDAPSAQPVGPNALALVGGRFGNTDSIVAQFDTVGRVIALRFVYPANADFATMVTAYRQSLGAPAVHIRADSASGHLERLTWQDARTRFELTRFAGPRVVTRMISVLTDRSALQ